MICGVDEAGRGPWAGPVVVAAAVIDPDRINTLSAVNDSKKLTEKKREELFQVVINACYTYSISEISSKIIDRSDILSTTLSGMKSCVEKLSKNPDIVIIDGNKAPDLPGYNVITVVDGDAKSLSVAAASILAKVYRDRVMRNFDKLYPGYGFAKHKGYGTKEHVEALNKLGVCAIHRLSYKPVAAIAAKHK
ncbi:MAG: ribonuclease HII [Candidatus Goldiibacteriota bacterium HGW-Goldbacteria-1]|jgi:ribonuclease HII|nr:MAG: ribonuclease HII [Candidatus Goldiibacteriota bacterium HGW-Goldbacteria-1]